MSNATTDTVDAIGKMHFEGNTVPTSWYQHIRNKEGKPDFVAITILSDVVYWYRPSEVRDEQTGQVIGYKKKFAADLLQRSYDQLADQFGISKEQARDACHRLRDAGLLRIEIRHGIRYGKGAIANNVVYLEPVPQAILEVSYRVTQGGVAKQPSPPSDVETNTLTTTETSQVHTHTPAIPETPAPKRQALETLEQEFFKVGGTLAPAVIEKFYLVYDTNPDHPQERMAHAMAVLREKRNIFRAIDAYREWLPPKLNTSPPFSRYQKQPAASHLKIRTD